MTNHFVSKCCEGVSCDPCLKSKGEKVPSTHKVGEEIFSDEPCRHCGQNDEKDQAGSKYTGPCDAPYHVFGPHAQRHNLTAYVCCSCFRDLFGMCTFIEG